MIELQQLQHLFYTAACFTARMYFVLKKDSQLKGLSIDLLFSRYSSAKGLREVRAWSGFSSHSSRRNSVSPAPPISDHGPLGNGTWTFTSQCLWGTHKHKESAIHRYNVSIRKFNPTISVPKRRIKFSCPSPREYLLECLYNDASRLLIPVKAAATLASVHCIVCWLTWDRYSTHIYKNKHTHTV